MKWKCTSRQTHTWWDIELFIELYTNGRWPCDGHYEHKVQVAIVEIEIAHYTVYTTAHGRPVAAST